ncbi:MAG: long-chain fatty acid transporter, partial [Methylobacterium sp.]|nr:long-chain fatty acid transporter [Methylobacterium sp.]
MRTVRKFLPCTIGLLLSQQVLATDGYFAHGYGVKSLGMGGVGIALPQDAIAAATNPAGMGLIGNRIDAGVTWFKPDRETVISGSNAPPLNGTYDGNDTEHFFIPEFGFNHQYSDTVTLGVSVYGNGGMNTDYKDGIPYFNGGTNRSAGVDLAQLFIAPTVTWKITPDHVVGLSLNLAYQRFEAMGLQSFDNPFFTSSPGNVTNNGHDSSYGAGLHVGWIGRLSDAVSVGATYQTKTYMTEFDDYKGLFAEQGDFDIPATYGLGIAVKATPKWTIAADVQRILYSGVDSVGRKSLSNLFAGNLLGTNQGPGFGWEDVTVTKIGVAYAFS